MHMLKKLLMRPSLQTIDILPVNWLLHSVFKMPDMMGKFGGRIDFGEWEECLTKTVRSIPIRRK